jgi:hypothetical protein
MIIKGEEALVIPPALNAFAGNAARQGEKSLQLGAPDDELAIALEDEGG